MSTPANVSFNSSPTAEDANIVLKLYELRREEVMRKARNYFFSTFFPETVDDIKTLLSDRETTEQSAYYRQVTSYWDMAAALVNLGTVNEQVFLNCNGEFLAVYAKIEPFLPQLRVDIFGPNYLMNLEKLVKKVPEYQAQLAKYREYFKLWKD